METNAHIAAPVTVSAGTALLPVIWMKNVVMAGVNTPDILRRVEAGDPDAGFVTMPRTLSRALTRVTLQKDPLAALVPAGMPGHGAVSPIQLMTMPLILYESGGDPPDTP